MEALKARHRKAQGASPGLGMKPRLSPVGANYRASCRAKSTADMINKLKMVEEEADETLYWMELLIESQIVSADKLEELIKETDEIISMIVASIRTLRNRK